MRSAISNFWQIEYFVGEFQVLKLVSKRLKTKRLKRLKNIILPEIYLQISVQIFFSRKTYVICKKCHVKESKKSIEHQKTKPVTLTYQFIINVTIWYMICLVTNLITLRALSLGLICFLRFSWNMDNISWLFLKFSRRFFVSCTNHFLCILWYDIAW